METQRDRILPTSHLHKIVTQRAELFLVHFVAHVLNNDVARFFPEERCHCHLSLLPSPPLLVSRDIIKALIGSLH
ncbi:hypothetical protein RDI58_025057 [Solanum bulbocastanum]|uniref:Uncharacterized protein n=1 Tax=Solanum bulbocastanum TaxID=147425 RepID=A0AAN8T2C4_SOLBU